MTQTRTQTAFRLIGSPTSVLVLVALLLAGCERSQGPAPVTGKDNATTSLTGDDAVVSVLVRNEETCLALSGRMMVLSKGLMELRLPASAGASVFSDEVTVTDLEAEERRNETSRPAGPTAEVKSWPVLKGSRKVSFGPAGA